jgi:predicted PurR-regulated permease PerM
MTLLNFIPYLGSLLINVAALAVGVVTFPTIEQALLALGVLVALSAIEANLITPALVGRRVEVGALAVFVAVAFGAWLWGAAGALMATPALLVVRAFALRMVRLRAPRPDPARRIYVR